MHLRKLLGYTHKELSKELDGVSYIVYSAIENPYKSAYKHSTYRTMRKVATALGIKQDLFFVPTNENGQITDKSAITDVMMLYSLHGFDRALKSKEFLQQIFIPEIVDYILETYEE